MSLFTGSKNEINAINGDILNPDVNNIDNIFNQIN